MRKFVYFSAAVLAVNVLMMGVAVGADLPRSGKFTIHSGFKLVGETTQVAEKHTFTYGGGWGVTYNDSGEGPLHLGSVLCSLAMEVIDTAGAAKGQCAWGDADSDKIFTDWSGKLTPVGEFNFNGMNQITGGTGKFAGIQGQAPFQCKAMGVGQFTCKQHFEYRLP